MTEIVEKKSAQTPKTEESKLLQDIRSMITAARSLAVRNINRIQVITNFKIGRRIVEEEQKGAARAEYGKRIIPELSAHLKAEFGRGFSRSNLEYMRKFYLTYQSRVPGISQTTSGKSKSTPKPLTLEENDVRIDLAPFRIYLIQEKLIFSFSSISSNS